MDLGGRTYAGKMGKAVLIEYIYSCASKFIYK